MLCPLMIELWCIPRCFMLFYQVEGGSGGILCASGAAQGHGVLHCDRGVGWGGDMVS